MSRVAGVNYGRPARKMASSTESPGPNGSSIYERTSNADLEKTSDDSSSEFVL